MTITSRYSVEESMEIASTIKRQIGVMNLMTLGASEFNAVDGGLRFKARILPFNSSGKRLRRPSVMYVEIVLNSLDYYDVRVVRMDGVEHYNGSNIDAFTIGNLMFALDYDGDEVLNPRVSI